MAKEELRIIAKPEKSGIKPAKRKLRKQLDNYRISLKDLARCEECRVSYQAVKYTFSLDHYYWNQDLINLAQDKIEEKKKQK